MGDGCYHISSEKHKLGKTRPLRKRKKHVKLHTIFQAIKKYDGGGGGGQPSRMNIVFIG